MSTAHASSVSIELWNTQDHAFFGLFFLTKVNDMTSCQCVIMEFYMLRRNPPDVGETRGQKPCTKTVYIVLQTSVGLF